MATISSGIAFEHATQDLTAFDPLVQQLYPIDSWGSTYGLIPFYNRNYFFKVVAVEDGTELSMNGQVQAALNAGEFYMPANNPVAVSQFAYVQADLSAIADLVTFGDPDMVILSPEEYNTTAGVPLSYDYATSR